jgi:hypothetical protein
MLDAKTISATLTLALLTGCSSKPAAAPTDEQPPVTHAPAEPSAPADAPTDMTTNPDASKTEPAKAEAAPVLPGGRTEPLPPKDAKPIASKSESKRTGAMACCGEGMRRVCAVAGQAHRAQAAEGRQGRPRVEVGAEGHAGVLRRRDLRVLLSLNGRR